MSRTIMLIGLGDLGGIILELLAREKSVSRIVVGSRDPERSEARCNLTRLGALAQDCNPDISFSPLDLYHPQQVAEIIAEVDPHIVICTASLLTWWLPSLLPDEKATLIQRAGFGAWLPVHLVLPMKLMEALRMIDYRGHILMAPYPDVVNQVLGKLDMAPTCGIGSLDEMVPKIQLLAAERKNISPASVKVTLVAHHALVAWVYGQKGGATPPYFLRVEHDGKDITEEVDADELLMASYPISQGPTWHFLTAGSAVRLIRALFSEKQISLHTPGPDGLPGGYPVIVSQQGVRVDLPSDLPLDRAIAINERSHRFDGIEQVEADGTVVFSSNSVEILHGELGYYCARLEPLDAETQAHEVIRRFQSYAARHGVELPFYGR